MTDLAMLVVREGVGVARDAEPIRIGVPLSRGSLDEVDAVALFDDAGRVVPAQFTALARWPDRSIRWLLVDASVASGANAAPRLALRRVAVNPAPGISISESNDRLRIDTGRAIFEVTRSGNGDFATVAIDGADCLARGMTVRASGARGAALAVRFTGANLEERGNVRVAVVCAASVEAGGREVARLKLRLIFMHGSAALRIECEIWNPRAARHPGGLWDLGDRGSLLLRDLSIELQPAQPPQRLGWQTAPGDFREENAADWSIYQDSSGGEHWNSPNHIDARGTSTVSFRGYRVQGAGGPVLEHGHRASPALLLSGAAGWICAGVENFWQNFPKALRVRAGVLSVGLFPAESTAGFELQGGEKKRHVALIEFGRDSRPRGPAALYAPLAVSVESDYLLSAADRQHEGYRSYVAAMLDGAHSVLAKREIIDEYGWRNFGDLYADHEAVNHRGAAPFVSHYNNQYDFVYGAGMQFLRGGDARWRGLMTDAARHHIDIDIYHTQEDRAAFNGGLFWHTDHYQPAATCSHRTYSRRNASGPYGGGPSCEHNYTSGLLLYHYVSGDPEARAAVLELADWVFGMDDGSRTLWALFDSGPTGAATATVEPRFQKVGRGAANSINALLDGYSASARRDYLAKAEEFVQRCIHPHDDIAALGLLEPEHRWSYLVFLQVLGKFLELKRELGEFDYAFHYAREALLHYAGWMSQHEVAYQSVLDKVLLPTETWPAQDIRKCHVLQLASLYAPLQDRAALRSRAAFFFERCLADLLSFPTAHLTRPQVLLCVYASQYEAATRAAAIEVPPHNHSFGAPRQFVIQRDRMRTVFGDRLRSTLREIRRAVSGVVQKARAR